MLLIRKEQWLWRGIVAPYQTARLKAAHEQWEPRRATQALTDLPPEAQGNDPGPRDSLCELPCALQPQRWGTALGGWLFNTEKAKHTTEARLLALGGWRGGGTQGLGRASAHAEETFGGCGGCAGGGCACEVLLGVACWVDSWDNWSLLERDFNSAFSRSSKEFLSTNSFICSFRTSTSSLTAYIKWLFTRSCKEQVETYITGKKSFLHPSPRTYCYCFYCSKPGEKNTNH